MMKTVFITGAAAGIGLAIAKRFISEGWFVGLYDINEETVEKLLQTQEFSNACGGYCDVTNRDSVSQALQSFSERTEGRMDAVVNNAGVLASGHFEDISHDAHDKIIQVNVQGLTNVAQLAFPWLKKSPNSTLVNMCSASSVHGIPQLAVYSASKFYVNGLTQSLSIEWAEHGISVLAIKPPFVKTAMVDHIPEQLKKTFTVDLEPEQIADVVMSALAGSGQSYIVGMTAKTYAVLIKLLPGRLGHRLTKSLTGY